MGTIIVLSRILVVWALYNLQSLNNGHSAVDQATTADYPGRIDPDLFRTSFAGGLIYPTRAKSSVPFYISVSNRRNMINKREGMQPRSLLDSSNPSSLFNIHLIIDQNTEKKPHIIKKNVTQGTLCWPLRVSHII